MEWSGLADGSVAARRNVRTDLGVLWRNDGGAVEQRSAVRSKFARRWRCQSEHLEQGSHRRHDLAAFVIGGIVWLATNTPHTATPAETPRFLGSTEVVPRDLFDQIDDTAAQLGLFDLHERLGEREPVSRGEEVENVGG